MLLCSLSINLEAKIHLSQTFVYSLLFISDLLIHFSEIKTSTLNMGIIFSAIVGAITWIVDKVGQLFGWVERVRPTIQWMINNVRQIISQPIETPVDAVRVKRQIMNSEEFQRMKNFFELLMRLIFLKTKTNLN